MPAAICEVYHVTAPDTECGQPELLKWWVDVSYTAHDNIRGHTGVTMYMGRGSVLSMSKKKNPNTESSTEAKLIGADDALPQLLWTKYFI